jgi:hypothetical protein
VKKKFAVAFLSIVVVSQVPFAYRRYRLQRLQTAIQNIAEQRAPDNENAYRDYSGVIHVHTFLGGHSEGTFSELIAAAKANRLDFVIMTEHPDSEFSTAAMTLNGTVSGVLFINGNEVVTANGDRLLLIPGSENANSANSENTEQVVAKQKSSGGLSIAAYPTDSNGWQTSAVDGVEIYNLFTNARAANKLTLFFDGLWSYRSYADLMFANFLARPSDNLKLWDQQNSSANRKLFALAGNDAHSNIGFRLTDAAGRPLLGMKLDPYQRSFRVVRTHVFIPKDEPLSRASLLGALAHGHCYISFDVFADPKGFAFTAARTDKIGGDEVTFQNGLELSVNVPFPGRIVLIKNGDAIEQQNGPHARFSVPAGAAVYRVECYLDSLPTPAKGKPWIISNPIFVR